MRLRDYDRDAESLGANEDCPMIRSASVLLLLFLAGTQAAMAQVEIVIYVPDGEAQTILQSYAADELAYAETSWNSSGRIRLARINSAALKQAGVEVQFTPFADVDPIVMVSHGIEDGTWTGERVYNRIDGFDEHGLIEREIRNHPQMKGVADDIMKRFAEMNIAKLGVHQRSMDPDSREYLLDPNSRYGRGHVINAQTNELKRIEDFERAYRRLQKASGIAEQCEQQSHKQPMLPPAQGEVIEGEQPAAEDLAGFGTPDNWTAVDPGNGEPSFTAPPRAPCKPSGHVLDRVAALPESTQKDPGLKDAHQYRRAKPLPINVLSDDFVSGSITDKSIQPFTDSGNPETHTYGITSLMRHPEYVLINERDKSRHIPLVFADDSGFQREPPPETEDSRKIEKLKADKAAHMDAARKRIDDRNQTGGDR